MARARFDPAAAWLALDDDQRTRIGEAALLLQLASEAQALSWDEPNPTPERLRADRRWEHAELMAWDRLEAAVPIDADLFPDGPDLAALGVRACRQCGCTDEHGCGDGCWWVAPNLCSSCAEPRNG